MQTTIDAAGRIVVPKALRDAMALQPGQVIDIMYVDGHLEVEIPSAHAAIVSGPLGRRVELAEPVAPMSADAVRQVTEQVRR